MSDKAGGCRKPEATRKREERREKEERESLDRSAVVAGVYHAVSQPGQNLSMNETVIPRSLSSSSSRTFSVISLGTPP